MIPVELESPRQFTEKEAQLRGLLTVNDPVNAVNGLEDTAGFPQQDSSVYSQGYQQTPTVNTVNVNDVLERGLKMGISDRQLSYILSMDGSRYHKYQERKHELQQQPRS